MPVVGSTIVIGDGIVGLACAVALQRRGVATTLIGQDKPWRGASWGNAGHIATEQVEPLASPASLRSFPARMFWRGGPVALPPRAIATWLPFAFRLARASTPARFASGKSALASMLAQAMPAWRRLSAESGVPELLREDGHYVVWESPATVAAGLHRWRGTNIGSTQFEAVSSGELARLQGLTDCPLAGAIRFSGSGQITDLTALATALRTRFAQLGGIEQSGKVVRVSGASQACVTFDDGRAMAAGCALVTAGSESARLLTPLGLTVPLIAERGYHIETPATHWPIDLPPVVFEDRSIIATRFRHGLRVAGFVEFAPADDPPDPRKWKRLHAHVRSLDLDFPGPIREWFGSRPTLPDYLPAIGRLRDAPAIAYAFGHQHLGLTLAATTAEAVASLLRDEPTPFDLTPFDLTRFD